MAGHSFIGNWEVTNCGYINSENRTLERVSFQFRLDDEGAVTWSYPDELKELPLFSCDTYEIYTTSNLEVFIRFAVVAGHVLEFRSDQFEPKDEVLLTCRSLCVLKCKRAPESQFRPSNKFTFLPALDEGFFSDVTITAANKKQFKVHSTILKLQVADIDWTADPPPFNGLPEDVITIILHFLYSECLPENISEELAKQVIEHGEQYKSLAKLVNMCKIYMKNMGLKQQIINLISDMHGSLNHIIEHFRQKGGSTESIASNPSQFCYVVKQSIRDIAVVGVNLLLLCDLFQKTKGVLPKSDRHDIIKYAKSRLPFFFEQLTKLIEVLKRTFLTMTTTQKNDISVFLAPEITVIMDKIAALISQIELALQQVIKKHISGYSHRAPHLRGRYFRYLLDIGEIGKLRSLQEHVYCSSVLLNRKRTSFLDMSLDQKVRSITRDLELLIEELPICLMRLDEDKAVFNEKLNWREFHFCFVVGTSKIASILQKLVSHREAFQRVLHEVCEVVQRESFNQSLKDLNMLDEEYNMTQENEMSQRELQNLREEYESVTEMLKDMRVLEEKYPEMLKGMKLLDDRYFLCLHNRGEFEDFDDFEEDPMSQQRLYGTEVKKFEYEQNLYIPPPSKESALTKLCENLLINGEGADMEFEVILGNNNADPPEGEQVVPEASTTFKAHRVIIAARCDWFRRALLSGMKEDIDKKIVVHDTNQTIFGIFLKYLYTDNLDSKELSNDQLIDLLLLSDRYEVDSLKQTCEYALQPSIDLETALCFTNLADQYNAKILKNACLHFITRNEELLESEEFFELPISLQVEIFDCIMKPCAKAKYIEVSPDEINSSTEPQLYFERNKLELCLKQIRDIVGDVAPREGLVRVILAADYDLCRAVNFFYARN